MQIKDLRRFIKTTEKMVVPSKVASTTQGSAMLRKLPLRLQRYIVKRGARNNPYMSFIVEPYAVFLAFEVTDTEAAERLLPPNYSLFPSAMFSDTAKRKCAIVSAFNVHTSVFWGSRVEFYLIAENCKTGLLSWIIIKYESNTHSYDPKQGFVGPSTSHSVVTTSYLGEIIIDVVSARSDNGLVLVADLKNGVLKEIDQRLWVEGNLSVDYGGELQQCTKPFSLVFDPKEMAQALKIPLDDISLCTNTFGAGALDSMPFEVACFPYAQHFVTTSVPTATSMRTAEDLEQAVNDINNKMNAPEEKDCNARANGKINMQDIVVVENLRKTYEKDVLAVDGISFRVQKGEIFGFLGPNGAGKSTTIKILTTLLEKSSGKATIDGLDIDDDQGEVRKIIGYSSQEVGVDDDLTARENLLLQCSFHHIPKEKAKAKVNELLQTVRLAKAADRRLKTFSGGMRKRLDLASSLVSDPKILFLDEPTTGLDPQSRQDVWDYIVKLNRQGMTIFLTTQYMEEADRLANRLCIVDQGKIVAEGTPTRLKAQVGADKITIRFKPDDLAGCEKAKELMSKLKGIEAVGTCDERLVAVNGLEIMTKNGSALVTQVVRALDGAGVDVEQLNLSVPTLDEVFLKLTGKTLNVVERKEAVGRWGRRRRRD